MNTTPLNATKSMKPPSRVGKKPVTAYVSKEIYRRIRLLGIELEKSNQDIVKDALADYLRKHEPHTNK